MPRPSNKQARRLQIAQALLHAMGTHGYDKATIQIIAQQAELSPGLIHYHFSNKLEILLFLFEHMIHNMRARYIDLLTNHEHEEDTRSIALLLLRVFLERVEDPSTRFEDELYTKAWIAISAQALREESVQQMFESVFSEMFAHLRMLLGFAIEGHTLPSFLLPVDAERPLPSMSSFPQETEQKASMLAAHLCAMVQGAFFLQGCAAGVLPEGYALKSVQAFLSTSLGPVDGVPHDGS